MEQGVARVIRLPEPTTAPARSRTLVVPLRATHGTGAAPVPATAAEALGHWATAVTAAEGSCLLVDGGESVVAASEAARDLLGLAEGSLPVALTDLPGLGPLTAGQPVGAKVEHPVSLTLRSGTFVRQLMRWSGSGETVTLDACCVPLFHHGGVAGAILWFARV